MSECIHEQVELRTRTHRNGATAHVLQCLRCGSSTRSVPKDANIDPPPFDTDLQERWWLERGDASAEKSRQWWAAYNEYLASPEWAAKRAKRLAWDRHVCQGCGAAAEHVHHLTYARLGRELLLDLVSLCKNCHEVIHS